MRLGWFQTETKWDIRLKKIYIQRKLCNSYNQVESKRVSPSLNSSESFVPILKAIIKFYSI